MRRVAGRRALTIAPVPAIVEALEERVLLAAISWDGGAGDNLWTSAANWSGNVVPGANDDVTIDVAGTNTIRLTTGNVSIRSLQSQENLEINSASLRVTNGASDVAGSLTLINATLTAEGSTTDFEAAGTTTLTGSSLFAKSDAHLTLLGATTFDAGSSSGDRFIQGETGGTIDLSNVASFVANTQGYTIYVRAYDGSNVLLPGLTAINNNAVVAYAEEAGSTIDLSGLVTWSGRSPVSGRFSSLETRAGSSINVSSLTTLIDSGLTVEGYEVSLPALTNVTGSSLVARGAAGVLRLPNLTSYSAGSSSGDRFLQGESGGTVDLSHVTSLTSNTQGYTTYIRAYDGSNVDLSALTSISNNAVYAYAEDAGSSIDLSALVTWNGRSSVSGRTSTLEARVGTAIDVSSLTTFIDSGLIVDSYEVSYPALTNVTGSSLVVRGAVGILRLPNLTNYSAGTTSGDRFLQGESGGTLDLSHVTSLTSNSQGYTTYIRAYDGSDVDVSSLTSINNNAVVAYAEDSGSTIDLSGLVTWNGRSPVSGRTSSIETRAGTTIDVASLTTLIDSGLIVDGHEVSYPALTDVTGSSLIARGAVGILRLPNLTNYSAGTTSGDRFLQGESGGTLDLSHVTSLTSNTQGYTTYIRAYDGSDIDVSALTGINNNAVYVYAEDSGSSVDLSGLTTWNGHASSGRISNLEMRDGTSVALTSGPLTTTYVAIALGTGVSMSPSSLTLGVGSSLGGSGTVIGDVLNSFGTVNPGFEGTGLTIDGDYTQGAAAVYAVDINGTVTDPQFDRLHVTGTASLDGTLRIQTTNPLLVPPGETLPVTTFASRIGTFGTVTGTDLGSGLQLVVTHNAQDVTLRATGSVISAGSAATPILPKVPGDGVHIDLFNAFGGGAAPTPASLVGKTPSGETLSPFIDFPNPGVVINVGNSFNNFFANTTTPPDQVQGLAASNFTLRSDFYLRVSSDLDMVPSTPEIDILLGVGSDDGYYLTVGDQFLGSTGDRGFSYTYRWATFAAEGMYPVQLLFAANAVGQSGLELSWSTATSNGAQIIPQSVLYVNPQTGDRSVTFEEVPSGTAVSDQFRNLGLIFTNVSGNLQTTSANPGQFVPVSPTRVYADPTANPAQLGQVSATFVVPGTNTPATTNFVSFYVIDAEGTGATVKAYDPQGNVIFNHEYHGGGGTQEKVTITSPLIARVEITLGQGSDTSAIDNFTFNLPISLPDLSVDTVVPASFTAHFDSSLDLSWITRNVGIGAVSTGWTEKVWLSTNPTLDGADTLLATRPSDVSSLVSQGFVNVGTTINLPQAGIAGIYYLIVETDTTGAVTESNEQNTAVSGPIDLSFAPLPDLSPSNVAPSVNAAAPGDTIHVTWVTLNSGSAAPSGPITEQVYLSDDNVVGNDRLIGTFTFDSIGVGAPRDVAITLPTFGMGSGGSVYLIVRTDTTGAVEELNELNNNAVSTTSVNVPLALSLSIPAGQVNEDGAPLVAVVSRNGSTTLPLVVSLASSDTSELTVPLTVTIPAGQSGTTVVLHPVADHTPDGNQPVTITATATNFASATANLSVVDTDLAILTVTIPSDTIVEGTNLPVTVTRSFVTDQPLTVNLANSSPAQVGAPVAVIIPANAASATFTLTTVSNNLPEPTQSMSITASAAGYASSGDSVLVVDDDLPTLALVVSAPAVSEGAGIGALTAIVSRAVATDQPLTVQIVLNSPRLRAPATVIIPAGSLSAQFQINAVENVLIDGDQFATIGVVGIYPGNGLPIATSEATTQVLVQDNDGPSLSVAIAKHFVGEGLAPATTATVSRNSDPTNALVVTLTSSNTSEATVPIQVMIPAGADSVTFDITTIADGVVDGTKSVTISAAAAGYSAGTDVFSVSDQNVPDLIVSEVTANSTALTDTFTDVVFRVTNVGLSDAAGTLTQRVLLSSDPFLGNDILIGNYAFTGVLQVNPPLNSFGQTVPVRIPQQAGDYWVIVITDVNNAIPEGIESNNVLVSASPIHVQAAYTATVATTVDTALANTNVPLSGTALQAGSNLPAAFVPISIDIVVRGFKRTITAITDSTGQFHATFKPLPGEAGHYSVTAYHPGSQPGAVQDGFTLVGMSAEPPTVTQSLIEGALPVVGDITIHNLSEVPLTAVNVAVINPLANVNVVATLGNGTPDQSLGGEGTLTLHYELSAVNATSSGGTIVLRLTTAEGATLDIPVQVSVVSLQPHLIVDSAKLLAGMVRGQQRLVSFIVTNDGGRETGPVEVRLPNVPWMSVPTGTTLPTIAPGQSAVVVLQLLPPADLPFGAYSGTLVLAAADTSLAVPFEFHSLSEAKGDLAVDVVDEFTFYATGAPHVANATITLTDPLTGVVVFTGTSDATGRLLIPDLAEGFYDVQVVADKHIATKVTVFVEGGVTTQQQIFTAQELVRYSFTVQPTTIDDTTRIVVESTFETNVPAPVVVVDPPVFDMEGLDDVGDFKYVNVTVTNHGLIAAQNLHFNIGTNSSYAITPLITDFGDLAANSSIVIPVKLERIGPVETSGLAAASGGDCGLTVSLGWELKCGPVTISFGLPMVVINMQFDPALCAGGPFGGAIFGGPVVGGEGGTFWFSGGTVSKTDCDPCGAAILQCLLQFVPFPDWYSCITGLANGGDALDGVSTVISCLGAFGKSVPYIGQAISIYKCYTGIRDVCLAGGGAGGGGGGSTQGATDGSYLAAGAGRSAIIDLIDARVARYQTILDAGSALFGSDKWLNETTGVNFNNWIAEFGEDITEASDDGLTISAAERAALEALPIPEGLNANDVTAFLDRWNRTVVYNDAGKFDVTDLSPGDNADFLARDVLNTKLTAAKAAQQQIEAEGFTSAVEAIRAGMQLLHNDLTSNDSQGVCARVRLQLDQDLVVSRSAFAATLDLENSGSDPLTAVGLKIIVTDAQGIDVTDRFSIRLDSLSNLSDVDGNGVLAASATGRARFILVPTDDAAPEVATQYFVSGILSYTLNGADLAVPLSAAPITVLPNPSLEVHYFHQRDVISDDPFTPEVEASQPFNLAVMVANVGHGVANNVSITSAQPKIIENEKGLLIDFQIIATQVDGDNISPSLTANFGTIDPGEIAAGRWLLTSTLQGQFIDYNATIEHVSSLGDKRLNLVDSVDIHELIHLVTAGGTFDDGKFDYLVNDIPDEFDTPDTLWLSNGDVASVGLANNVQTDGPVAPGDLQVQLTANVDAGWNYFKLPDPGQGKYRLIRAVRSDGFEVPIGDNVSGGNAWQTDRTFVESGHRPIPENNLHLLDFGGTGEYTLFYAPIDTVGPVVTSVAGPASVVSTPVDSVTIDFSENIDGSTLTRDDLVLTRNGSPTNLITNAVTIVPIDGNSYRVDGLGALTTADGSYRLEIAAPGVTDEIGNAGTGIGALEWVKAELAPAVSSMSGAATPRNTPVSSVDVTFTQPLLGGSFDTDDLTLTRDGAPVSLAGVSLSFTPAPGGGYTIAGLGSVTSSQGAYVLTVLATGVSGTGGLAGVGQMSVAWTMDTTAPTINDLTGLPSGSTNGAADTADVTFNEPINLASFTGGDIALTRNGAPVDTSGLTITPLSSTKFRISGLGALTAADGDYVLEITGSSIADLAGNSGTGSISRSWRRDTVAPAPAHDLAFSPDAGVAGDAIVNVLSGALGGLVNENGLTITVFDVTSGQTLGSATNSGGTAFLINIDLSAAGKHQLRVRASDAAGNFADSFFDLFVDASPPTVDHFGNVPATTVAPAPSYIEVVFTEPIDQSTVGLSDLTLTRDGGPNLLPGSGALLEWTSPTTLRISGLSNLVLPDGTYALSVDATGILDLAGNSGTTVTTANWQRQLAAQQLATLRGVVFNDANQNKVLDGAEAGLVGWTVYLDMDESGTLSAGDISTVTGADGSYSFEGLTPGTYIVAQVLPAGWVQTFPNVTSTLGPATAPAVSSGVTASTEIDGYIDPTTAPGGTGFVWKDHDVSTPDVIDVYYDFRSLNGYGNHISSTQIALAERALAAWAAASSGHLRFVRNTEAPASEIINIGTGDLAALGYTSGVRGTIGLGGATFSHSGTEQVITSGIVWLDEGESFDETYSNGNIGSTFDYYTVVSREIGHALGLAVTQTSPDGQAISVADGTSQTLFFQTHCGCGGVPVNGVKYSNEEIALADSDRVLLQRLYLGIGAGDSATTVSGFYTGTGTGFTWSDRDPSTPDVIDIYYDYRSINGYANQITASQIALAEQALAGWVTASAEHLHFVRSTTAPDSDIINIGTGDLAALAGISAPGGTLALGGGTFTTVSGTNLISSGRVWLDSSEHWDETYSNGSPAGTYDYFTIVAHEIGHALGLGHTDRLPDADIMDGTYAGEKTAFSANDRSLIRTLYSQSATGGGSGGGSSPGDVTIVPAGALGVHIVTVDFNQVLDNLNFGAELLDSTPPESAVSPLPATTTAAGFLVSWSGSDNIGGSGIVSFDVFVSDNGGAPTLFQDHTTATSALFAGVVGHTYTFYSVARDGAGNEEAAPAVADASITILQPVAVQSLQSVASPRSTELGSLTFTFTGAIDPASLTSADFTLTRDGGANLLSGAETVSFIGGTTYRINGLSGLTRLDGNYLLTVSAAGVLDTTGNPGSGSLGQSWTMNGRPFLTAISTVSPSPRETSVESLDVTFSEPIDLATLTTADFTLKFNNAVVAFTGSETITHVGGTTYRISGLSGLTNIDGTYGLTISANAVQDLTGQTGTGSLTRGWTLKRIAPIVKSFAPITPNPTSVPLDTIGLTFSEPIDQSTFDVSDLTLKRGSTVIPLPAGVTLVPGAGNTWQINGLSNATSLSGTYAYGLIVNMAGIKDANGIQGTSTHSVTWTQDFVAPTVSSITNVTPSPRNVPVDAIKFTLSEKVQPGTLTLASLSLTRNGGTNLLTSTETLTFISGNTWQLSGLSGLTGEDGSYLLSVDATGFVDMAGNPGAGSKSINWTTDSLAPTSSIEPFAAPTATSLSLVLSITGNDPVPANGAVPSGLKNYDIYVSTDGGAFVFWKTVAASTTSATTKVTYTAQSDHIYAFHSLARDKAGNVEAKAVNTVEATIAVPDLSPPATQVTAVDTSLSTFVISMQGSDVGSNGVVAAFDLYVSIDGAAAKRVATVPGGAPDASGVYHAQAQFRAIADGAVHNYRFYSVGKDGTGKTEAAPAAPADFVTSASFPPDQVTGLDVQKGQTQRSYVRNVDLLFSRPDDVAAIVASISDGINGNDGLILRRYNLAGTSPVTVALAGKLSAVGNQIAVDFGATGLTTDGYYELGVDLDGNGTIDQFLHFDRLNGDLNGDRVVDAGDKNLLALALLNSATDRFYDLNGDGLVNNADQSKLNALLGHQLGAGLPLDD